MAKKIIIGRNPVFEFLKSRKDHNNSILYIAKNTNGKIIGDIIKMAKSSNAMVNITSKFELSKISQGNHQGVILISFTSDTNQSIVISEDELLENVSLNKGVIVLLDQLTDPHNIGSIIRSTEALGADGIIMMKHNSPEINETIIKTAAGATSYLPIITIHNASTFIDKAKKLDFWVAGSTDHGDKDIKEIAEIRPLMLVIGNEGKGMRRLTEEKCDFLVKIPLKGKINSLNASVAAGILLHEILNK